MSVEGSLQREDSKEFQEIPIAFPPLGTTNGLEIRRYKKKEEVLRQILSSAFKKKDRVSVLQVKEFLMPRLPENIELNMDLFAELFQASDPDSNGLISMYFEPTSPSFK